MKEKAVLVTLDFDSMRRSCDPADAAEELRELSLSAGLSVVSGEIIRQKAPNAALLIGRGKAEALRGIAVKHEADVAVFDNDLSSSQQRNLEEALGVKTLDRTQLILDIFARRAHSNEGKLQVELAQLKYLLPRLAGKGITLSRLGGGVGTRGPGEQKLEMDRRRIRERIARLSRELEELKSRRLRNIHAKKEKDLPIAALVGYTNVGKSALFNRLAGSSVTVKDQLFSTLDTTTRLVELPGNQKVLLADTVGFIRDLPHQLIESFKATLEEAVHSDFLVHVIDASRPDFDTLKKSVEKALEELEIAQKKTVLVLNKIDLLDNEKRDSLMRKHWKESVLVSAKTGEGLQALLERFFHILPQRDRRRIYVPGSKFGLIGYLYEEGKVLERVDKEKGSYLAVDLTDASFRRFCSMLKGNVK